MLVINAFKRIRKEKTRAKEEKELSALNTSVTVFIYVPGLGIESAIHAHVRKSGP